MLRTTERNVKDMHMSRTTQHRTLLSTGDFIVWRIPYHYFVCVLHLCVCNSCHARVRHHTASSIAQHWRFEACQQTKSPYTHQAPRSTEHCSALQISSMEDGFLCQGADWPAKLKLTGPADQDGLKEATHIYVIIRCRQHILAIP